MVAGTPRQTELGTLGWQRSKKRDKQGECTSLGSHGDGVEVRLLDPGAIRD